jgi:ribosome-associated protein
LPLRFPVGGIAITQIATPSQQSEQQTRQFAIESARLAANTRCHNVALLDVRGISPVTDYMVIATGTSPRQMRTVCNDLADWAVNERGVRPYHADGLESEMWMLIDFVDVVVHVFNPEARLFYDLDSLWGDAQRVEWNDNPLPPPPNAASNHVR